MIDGRGQDAPRTDLKELLVVAFVERIEEVSEVWDLGADHVQNNNRPSRDEKDLIATKEVDRQ